MSAQQNSKAAKSMTEHFSLGHKAVAVAMSVVLLGFGWPAVSPTSGYADSETAKTQAADSTAGGTSAAKKSESAASAEKAASTEGGSNTSNSKTSGESSSSASKSSSSASGSKSSNGSKSESSAKAAEDTQPATSVVKLVLNNAYITYNGQKVAQPSTKVTVPTASGSADIKFTVTPDEGYDLAKVVLTVNGSESELYANSNGVYTLSVESAIEGATVELVTTKQETTAAPQADAETINENTQIADETTGTTDASATTNQDANGTNANDANGTDNGSSQNNASGEDGNDTDSAASNNGTENGTDTNSSNTNGADSNEKANAESNSQSSSTLEVFSNFLSGLFGANGSNIAATSLMVDNSNENAISTASELGNDTDTEKWIYVGDTTSFSGTSGYNHSWTSSSSSTATVSGSESWSGYSYSSSTGTVTGVAEGDATITHTYYTKSNRDGYTGKTETFTIHVVKAAPATSVSITGADSVEAFSSTQLTATTTPSGSGGAATWTSSNEEILTVDSTGKVTGARQGTATVTVSIANSDGTTVTSSKDIEVTATTTSTDQATVYYLLDPTKDANSNDSGNWGPAYGTATVNVTDATWTNDRNCFDNVDQRVVSWPNGTNVVTKDTSSGSVWMSIFEKYKESVQEQCGTEISADDVEEISLVPAKISRKNGTSPDKHLDCNVTVKMKKVSLIKYYLRDAGSTQWTMKGSKNYINGKETQPSDVTSESFPETKTSGGVTYTFSGWYLDQNLTQPVTFPYTVTSEQTFYAKYVGGFQVKYDLGGGTWNNSDSLMYTVEEGKSHTVKKEPTRVGYKFTGWTVTGLDGTTTVASGDTFTMPAGNVTITANWEQLTAYNVEYLEQGTGTSLASSVTHYGEMGQEVSENAIAIDGYHLASNCPAKIDETLGSGDNTIRFWYVKDNANYTVNYYVNGTEDKVADSETKSAAWGSTVSVSDVAKSVTGYTLVPNQSTTITVNRDGSSSINVYYYINSKLTANSESVTYNGSEQSVEGYTSNAPEGTTFDGVSLTGGKGTNAGDYAYNFADGTVGKVSSDGKYIVSEVKNGNLHISPVTQEVTIKVTGNKGGEKYNGTAQTVSGYEVSDLPSGVSKDDVAYSGTASITKTDAGTYAMGLDKAKFALSGTAAANYTNVKFVVEDGELAIAKRAVTLSSEDGHKNYDGKTLQRRTNIKVTGDGFVGDDGVLAKDKLTWYDENNILPGTYENKFDPAYTSSTNINNYEVTLDFGELVVNAREDKDKYEVTVTAVSGTKTYNGQEQSVSGVTGTTYTNDKGAVYTIEGLSASVSGTDAGTYSNKVTGTAVVRDEQGNDVTSQFKVSTADGKLVINKKDATITAGSASKQYDGTELTTNEFSTDGFVDGQGIASVEIEGSQTTVGNSASSVKENSWKANKGTNLNNYNISTANGTLTVTNRDAKFEIALQANGGESTYNGSEQTVSGLVSNTFVNNGKTYTVSGLTVGAAGTNAGTYATTTTGTAVVKDANDNDVSDQFNITVTPAKLVIGKKAVTLRSADLSKKYDGTALTNGDTALATNEGFVEGQGITPTFTGSQTAAGTSNNTFSYVANEGTNLDNYNITATPGTLTVEQSDAKVVVTIVGNASTTKYNGSEQSVTGYKVTGITVDGEATTLFTESDVQFAGEASAARTNAGTTVMGLTAGQFSSINANFKAENVTFDVTDGSIVVNPREVTLTSADDSKTYDGNALANNKVTVGGDGFVNGEGATYDVTGTITNAGTAENAFTYKLTDGATEGEGGNYVITKVPGTLTVNPVSTKVIVTIGGNKVSTTYDGDTHAATGYTTSIDNTLYKESDFAFDGTATVEQTNAGIYAMGLQVGQFRNISGNFTNVEFVVTDGELAIAKRAVTLQSASDEKYYDGDPLTNHNVSVSEGSFVKGQGFEATVTGTRTLVGTSENTYTYKLVNGATSDNYTVTQSVGTLTVKNRDAKWGITVEANSGEFLYDGTSHTASGLKNTTFTFNNKTYTVSGLTATATATDAGTYDVNVTGTPVVKDADGVDVTDQFSVATKAGKLTVNKRTVKITSSDATREYNGEALTAHEVKVEGDGFAKGEGATYNYSGTITNVGEASNDFEYTLNAGTKASNYNISTDEGTLTVTPLKSEVVVTIRGNTNAATYDGGSHTASGYEVSIRNNLYKQGDIAFNGSSTVSATDVKVNAETGAVEAYAMGLASNQFSNNNTNFDNVKFVVENDGVLTINKRTVNLTSESAEKAYDGTELTKPNVTVDGDGFVAGEVSNLKATGSVLNNGDEATNTIVYDKSSGYKDTNYTVNKTEGTLKIMPAQTVEATWNIGTGLEQKVYDGTPLKPYEATATDSYGNALTVEYSLDGINWYTDRSQATITHFGYAEVKLRARSDNYAEGVYATASESIMVTARPVWITSEGASKAYDGQPLTNSNVSVVDKGAGTGFVSGEGADIKATGAITNVGTTPNTITVNFNEGTNSVDYNIRKTEGTLTVTDAGAVVVTIAENSGTAIYDGTQHSVTGYEVKSITIGDAATTLYTEDDFSFSGDATVAGTDAGTYDMQLKASDFTNNNTNFSNVTFVIEDGTLAIAKRDVELGSGGQEFTYTGQAQTLPTATGWRQEGDKGFVAGEVSNVYASGSVTNVGDTATNTVVWTNGANFKAGNYNISRDEGTLSVKAKSIVPGEGVDMSVTAPADVKYNGQSQQQKPVVKDGSTTLVEGKDYELEYSTDTTNAGTVTVTIKGKGNYTGETTTTYQITVRNVTLTSATDTKAYDGSPLTNGDVAVGGDGFVQGEGASYDVTGSQTVVGGEQGNNTFSYKLNDGTLAGNYSINTVNGTLTVTPSLALVTVTITENSGTATYDGTEHTATGYQVNSIKLGGADTTLYKASDFSFNGDATVAGTDAGTYDMQLKEADFANNNGNFSNVKFVIEDGTLVVSPRSVTIASATLTQTYNGNALTNGDTALIVSGQGFVGEQGVTPTFTGSQTVVGSSANAYSYAFNEGTKASNYTVTKTEGTLNVISRDAKYQVTVKANSGSATYDGKAHQATGVETYKFTVEGNEYTVSGLTTEDPSKTDAGTYSNNITGTPIVTDANGNVVTSEFQVNTENGSLVIAEADVTLASATDSKTYDGNALTNNNVTATGFAEGEGASYDVTGTITNAGTVDNAFTYTLNSNTKATNYNIAKTEGKLTVNPITDQVTVTITGKSETKTYNGAEQQVTGYAFSADNGLYTEADLTFTGDATAKGTNVGTYNMNLAEGQFSNKNTKNFSNVKFEVADGKLTIEKSNIDANSVVWNTSDVQHKYDGNAVAAATATATDKYGNALHVQYSTDGQNWVDDPAQITATNYSDSKTVQLRATSDNYSDYATSQEFINIAKRTLKFESASATKAYDGTALTRNAQSDVAVTGDGFVAGEGVTFSITGSQTEAGQSKNAFTYSFDEQNTKSENYWVMSKTEGTLTVTASESEVVVTILENSGTFTYDGTEHTVTGYTVKSVSSKLYTENDFSFNGVASVSGTEAGTYDMDVKAADFKNNDDNFAKVTFVVEDGQLTITSKSIVPGEGSTMSVQKPADVVYNGAEQYQKPVVKDGDKTLVEGTDYTLTYTTDVTSAGTVTVTINGQGNYSGSTTTTYTIAKREVNLSSLSNTWAYDGTTHSEPVVSGWQQSDSTGFVTGEVSDVKATGQVTKVSDGTVTNTIVYTPGQKFNADNYTINKAEGTLAITASTTPVTVTITENSGSYVFDGTQKTVTGYAVTGISSSLYGQNDFTFNGNASVSGTAAGTYPMELASNNFTNINNNFSNVTFAIVDGALTITSQSIDPTDPTPGSYKGVTVNNPVDVTYNGSAQEWTPEVLGSDGQPLAAGTDYTVSYSTDTTNVGAVTVTITGMGNYSGTVTRTYNIKPAELTVTTPSASKAYDGTALTAAVTLAGLVNGETAAFTTTGTQTQVGSSSNTYAIDWNAAGYTAKQGNYTIKSESLGTLTVTQQSIDPNDPSYKGVSVSQPSNVTYDAATHQWAPVVTDGSGNTLSAGTDYTVAYKRGDADTTDFTNAGTITVVITGTGQYSGTVTRTYQIEKRSVTLSSESHTFIYNGSDQGWNEFTCSDSLFASQVENMGCKNTVKNTADTAENTVTYTFKSGFSADNYSITTQFGTLSVKNSTDEIVVTTKGGSYIYDGQAHGATVTVSELPAGYSVRTAASTATATDVNGEGISATADNLVIVNAAGEDVTSQLTVKKIDGTIKIAPATLTVVTPDASKTYDGNPLASAGSVSGFVNGETATFTTTGAQTKVGSSKNTYSIDWNGTAKQSNYAIDETVGTLTVTKQSINPKKDDGSDNPDYVGVQVGNLENVVYDGANHNQKPTVTDKNGVALTEGTDYKVEFSNDTKNAGTVTVTITGTGNYSGTVTRTFEVTKRPVTIESGSASKVYDGSALTSTAANVTSQYGFVADEVDGIHATGTITNVGTATNTIEYSTHPENGYKDSNYEVATKPGTLAVTKATAEGNIKLATNSASKTYDGSAIELPTATATASVDGNAVTIEYLAATGWTTNASDITATNVADSKKVQVRASSEANYEGYVYGEASLNVGTRSVELSSQSKSKTYDGTALEASEVTIAGDGFVAGEVSDVVATGSITNVGSTANTINYTPNAGFVAGNYSIEAKPGTLTVNAKSIADGSIEVNNANNATYDGQEHKFVPVVTDGGKPLTEGVDYTVSYSKDDFTNATGTITVTIAGTGNYAGTVTRTYEITPAPLTVVTDSASKVYNGQPLQGTGTLSGLVNNETATFTVTGSQTAVGTSDNTYMLEFNGTAASSNYTIASETIGKLTVTETTDVIVATTTGGTFTYNGQAHGATVTVTGLPEGYSVKSASSNATATNVEDGTVTATADDLIIVNAAGEDVTSRVTIKKVDGAIAIIPATLTVTTPSANKTYDGSALVREGSVSGFVNGETAAFATTGSQTDYGTSKNGYGINWNGTAKESNYAIKATVGTLSISKAVAKVSTESATKFYDGTPLAAGGSIALANGETATVNTSASQTEVGSTPNSVYTVDWNGTAKADNYTVDDGHFGTLEVKAQSIDPSNPTPGAYQGVEVAGPEDTTYNGTEQHQPVVVTDKDGNPLTEGKDYTVTYSTDATNAGTVTVTITGTGNYSGMVEKTYTINPAEAVVNTESATKVYDGTALTAGGSITLVNNETASVTTSSSITNVGSVANDSYTVVWNGTGNQANYKVVEGTLGTLTVTAQSINPKKDDGTDDPDYKGVEVTWPGDVTYNGTPQNQKPVVRDADGNVLVEGVDYDLVYSEDATNAGTVTVTVVGKGNYAGQLEGSYSINPAQLTVATGSATKVYDGAALTSTQLEIQGVVSGERLVAATNGSQTEVGSSTNGYSINWDRSTAKQNNYTVVSEVLGTLTVTAAAPADGGTTPTATPTTPAGTTPAATTPVQPVIDALAQTYTAITDEPAVTQPTEQIYDDENPLGTTEAAHCWVHFYMIISMILTALYAFFVALRRGNHTRKLKNDMNDVLGGGGDDGKDPVATTKPAGMEA